MEQEKIKKIRETLEKVGDPELRELIEELIQDHEHFRFAAYLDQLTGIYNRRVLEGLENYHIVVMCDIDNFKSVNDNFGHRVGDEVLKYLADLLSIYTRKDDVVCRYGGDEFLVIFNGCDQATAKKRMEKIRRKFRKFSEENHFPTSLSVGISFLEGEQSLNDIIHQSDIALYQSKKGNKNTITLYESSDRKIQKG